MSIISLFGVYSGRLDPFTGPAVAGVILGQPGTPAVQWHRRVVELEEPSSSAPKPDQWLERQ
jgi:hypothetical protein